MVAEADNVRRADMILRSLHIKPTMDSEYRRRAFAMGVSKAELMRTVLEFGEKILKTRRPQSLAEFEQALASHTASNYPLFGEENEF